MKNFLTEGSCVFLWKFDCVCLWFILRNPRNKGRNLWHGVLMMSVAGLFHWILIFTVNHSVRMPLMEWSCPIWPVKCWHQTLVLVSGVIHLTYFFPQILWTIDKWASWNDMQNYFPFLNLSLPRFYYGSLGRTVHCDFLKLHWSTKVLDSGHRSSTDVNFCWSKGYFKIIFLDISVMKVIRSHQSPMTDCFYPSIF